jgi:hypothetical protein
VIDAFNPTLANFTVRPDPASLRAAGPWLVEGRTAPFTLRQAQRERLLLGFSKFAKVQLLKCTI